MKPINLLHSTLFKQVAAKDKQWALDFLPEYQVILQSSPSSVGRYLGILICLLLLFFILWACLLSMDIVATTHGKLTPAAGTKVIQSSTLGVVVNLPVKNGDKVDRGQLLVQFDDDEYQAKALSIKGLMLDAQLEIARLEALQSEDPENAFKPPVGLTPEQLSAARDRLRTTQYYYQTQIEGLKISPSEAGKPNISNTTLRVRAFKSEFHEKIYANLLRSKNRLLELTATFTEVEEAISSRVVYSPVVGTVQELKITTLGAVAQPAEKIMVIVPEEVTLQAIVMIPSKDRGFIRVGQQAEIKIDSFPYTRFGMIEGTVAHIAKDAIAHERQGLLYPAKIDLKKQFIQTKVDVKTLQSGMKVTAEIKTGRRRIISYLLSPLQEYQTETLRER